MLSWILIMLGTGLAAGVIGGLLGIGGCSIILPVLIFVFNYPEPIAIGTTITAVIITAVTGAFTHARMKNVDHQTSAIVNVFGGIGAALGSIILALIISKIWLLDLILGAAFIYTALRMLYEGLRRRAVSGPSTGKSIPGSFAAKALLGFGVGLLAGLIGLGGGYLLVPSYIYFLHAPVKLAVGTSLESFIGLAVVSSGFKLAQKLVDVVTAIVLGVGIAVGVQIGAKLVPRTPAWAIKALFGAIFFVVAVKFMLNGIYMLL